MPGLNYKSAGTWENKFRTPSGDDLLFGLAKHVAQVIDVARVRLRQVPGTREDIVWHGLPWRWTFAFRAESEPARPWAYVVPEPGKPRLVLPLTLQEIGRLPLRKLTKPARDPLSHGVEVDGVHWVEWELNGRAILEEVLTLALNQRGVPVDSQR